MNNHVGIAVVTASIRRLIHAQIVRDLSDINLNVTSIPPKKLENISTDSGTVNVYLYQALPSPSLQNMDLPYRDSNGKEIHQSLLPLDLYYLISFYGDEQGLIPQRLMGSAGIALHENGILPRPVIQAAINDPADAYLRHSDLASEPYTISISPVKLDIESLSKIWSVFLHTPYALSMVIKVSSIHLRGDEYIRSALPILHPDLQVNPKIHRPGIQDIRPDKVVAGNDIHIRSISELSEHTKILINQTQVPITKVVGNDAVVNIPDSLASGPALVQIQSEDGMVSEARSIDIVPEIVSITQKENWEITLKQPVSPSQNVIAVINQLDTQEALRKVIQVQIDSTDPKRIVFKSEIPAGRYLVRVSVNGSLSLLEHQSSGQFTGPVLEAS